MKTHGANSSPAERRKQILNLIQDQFRVSVGALSENFGISEVSIRRDLNFLEEKGLIQRVHGGAEILIRPGQPSLFEGRRLQNRQAKQAIGRVAASQIRPGEVLLLDTGTTVLEVARHIPQSILQEGELTVNTRSLSIAHELHDKHPIRLIVLGGLYNYVFDSFSGLQTERAVQGIHVNTLFMGIDGVTAERGLSSDNVMEATLFQLMAQSADRVIVVTDSSKIGVDKLQIILSFDNIQIFVTDTDAPPEFVNMLRRRGIEVILAPVES